MPRIGGAVDIVQVSADPPAPVAGREYFYFKSDGRLYHKTSDGTVSQHIVVNDIIDAGPP